MTGSFVSSLLSSFSFSAFAKHFSALAQSKPFSHPKEDHQFTSAHDWLHCTTVQCSHRFFFLHFHLQHFFFFSVLFCVSVSSSVPNLQPIWQQWHSLPSQAIDCLFCGLPWCRTDAAHISRASLTTTALATNVSAHQAKDYAMRVHFKIKGNGEWMGNWQVSSAKWSHLATTL